MKFAKLAITVLTGAVMFCGCVKDNTAIIKVNDTVITKQAFDDDYKILKDVQLKQLPEAMRKEDGYMALALKDKLIKDLITRTLLNQEIAKKKITVTQEEINEKKTIIINQIGTEDKFKKTLKENNISEERFISDVTFEIQMEKLMKTLGEVKVSDKQAEKFYKDHKSQFNMPESVRTAHILIDTNPENVKRKIIDKDKKAKLSEKEIDEQVKKQVKENEELVAKVLKEAKANPKNFAKLAKEYSQDIGSAQNGGDLGYAPRGQFVPEFEKVAFSTKVGTIAEPVKTQYGTHIIYVKDKAAKGSKPYSAVKEDIKAYLLQQEQIKKLTQYTDVLKNSAKIEFVDSSYSPENIEKQIKETIGKQAELNKLINQNGKK